MRDIKLMEWQEEQFIEHIRPLLTFGTIMNYSHKINMNTGLNVYLVSEEFYLKALQDNQ